MKTENRYSGIPTIRREMRDAGLPMPQFEDNRSSFKVTLLGKRMEPTKKTIEEKDILDFCSVPRSREELANFLGIKSVAYAMRTYIVPLIEKKKLILSNPEHPKSPSQKIKANGTI